MSDAARCHRRKRFGCPPDQRRAARGFTLVEILVVLAIVGLLLGLVGTVAMRYMQAGSVADCQSRIQQISLLARSYFDRTGDYPPSRLDALGITDGNGTLDGIEAFVAALRGRAYGGQRPDERWLANGDDDHSKLLRLVDGSSALLEIVDPWDQPFVYIASSDYGRDFTYGFEGDDGLTVRAAINPLTGGYHQFESFQVLSVGPDGILDTADDLANYLIETDG